MLGYEGTFFILPKHDCGFVIISNYNEANVKLLVLPLGEYLMKKIEFFCFQTKIFH
jgi:hypothetical protein